ncbi:MAG TPA: hypothetical protein PLZ24_07360, partial [Flavobacteriales bacterium]|nr:hypothetical protein [Flavobacteriales bacterium]
LVCGCRTEGGKALGLSLRFGVKINKTFTSNVSFFHNQQLLIIIFPHGAHRAAQNEGMPVFKLLPALDPTFAPSAANSHTPPSISVPTRFAC